MQVESTEQKEVEKQPSVEQPTEQQTVAKQEPETQEQINWKKFREAREKERKQKEEAEKRAAEKAAEAEALKAAMDALLNKQSAHPNTTQYSEEEETEDQRIQKKIEAHLEARERALDEERKRREQAEFPQRLTSAYSDFNKVCTPENLDYLEYHYPEVAGPLKHLPEGFDKWSAVYKAVKRFIANTESNKDQKRAEKNFAKPQSMSVSGSTQTGDGAPVILDDKRRADNWTRMQRVMKGG